MVNGPGAAGLEYRIRSIVKQVPRMEGPPIHIRFLPALTGYQGKLLSKKNVGTSVHAGAFPRKRRIVFDTALLADSQEFRRIFVHEIFHFVWLRLGNPSRKSYEEVVQAEFRKRAPGELGWSAEWRKQALSRSDLALRNRRWREYVCESFCDSAAWLYSDVKKHPEFTLPGPFRKQRDIWFRDLMAAKRVCV